MAMFESNIDYTKFIQFTNEGGLRIATFPEIRDALVRRYMEIYGNDIDTSSASADGQFINSIALIINNMCNTFQFAFKQMNPNTATGQYLDTLCSYNNVQRISETNSTVELLIYNNSDNPIIPDSNLLFMDRNGNIWQWIRPIDTDGNSTTTFNAHQPTPITDVECLTVGAIQAFGTPFLDSNGDPTDDINNADWSQECLATIYQFVENQTDLRVWQYQDAVVGRNMETDESLRSRRTQMIGINSVSILEGLKGALLNLTGIKDVFIYNNYNNNGFPLTAPIDDGTTVKAHSIYIAIRYEEGINIENSTIANIIYNKLTPGIGTTPLLNDDDEMILNNGDYFISGNGVYYIWNSSTNDWDTDEHEPSSGNELNPIANESWYQINNEIKLLVSIDYNPIWITIYKYTFNITDSINYSIYWKKCESINPTISLTFKVNSNYDYPINNNSIYDDPHDAETDVEKNIVKNLKEYLNDVKIDNYLNVNALLTIIQQSDILKNGMPTLWSFNGMIGNDHSTQINYPMNLSYLKYNNYKFTYDTGNSIGTLTINYVEN